MFGYVLPLRPHLSEEEGLRYKAAYCGLCRSLKQHYGFRSRFLVNYDMTFLYFLLSKEKEPGLEPCFCPAKPFCKKDCMPEDPVMVYATDLTVLLSYWKLRDALQDGHFFKRILARMGLGLFHRAYGKAAERRQEENQVFEQRLSSLQELEASQCASMDRAADGFASLLRACAGLAETEKERRILEMLLYHVGRYLYLVDALEDLPKDIKADSYNPIRYRYELVDGKLSQEDREQLVDTIEASIGMAASALELLPKGVNTEILDNIIYEGLPAVLRSVNEGSFRKRRSKK